MSITKTKNKNKKIQTDENESEYILFRTDICFIEYSLAVEIDEKGHIDRDLIFEKKDKALEKELNCTFIRINTSREIYDAGYEASRIQVFISQFKENKIKERDNKIKALEDEMKKLKLQLTNQNVSNGLSKIFYQITNNKKCAFIVKSVKDIQVIHFQKK